MTVTLSVMYPNTPGAKFDMDYYLGAHFDLVGSKWSDKGMVSARAVKGLATPDPDVVAPYLVMALVEFESLEALQAALAETAAEIMGDVPSFTDIAPEIQISENL